MRNSDINKAGPRQILKRAREVLLIESQAVKSQIRSINRSFVQAIETLHRVSQNGGQIVVMGIGKSGLVGRKIAATFSSTGTPSIFFHPTEGLHGDLGMIRSGDAVLVLSASGETDEIRKILPLLKQKGLPLIAITSSTRARLAKASDFVILCSVRKEACPLNLAPTASTTAMLALGDAIAMALMEKNGFREKDFAMLHPGGSLGKKLFMKVKDIMHTGRENPVVRADWKVRRALLEMTRTRMGATHVVDDKGMLVGFFTDGDLRRKLQSDPQLLGRSMSQVMTRNPQVITPEQNLHEALNLIRGRGFDNLPVVDSKKKPVGILDERDLLALGIA